MRDEVVCPKCGTEFAPEELAVEGELFDCMGCAISGEAADAQAQQDEQDAMIEAERTEAAFEVIEERPEPAVEIATRIGKVALC